MKHFVSFYKLIVAAAMVMPIMVFAKITPTPEQDFTISKYKDKDCYEISSPEDLYGFAAIVNGDNDKVCGKLTKNITVNKNVLTSADGVSNVDEGTGDYKGTELAHIWTPIGKMGFPFAGEFHGQGHTISGLYFNNKDSVEIGLFGYVGDTVSVIIDSVGLVDSYFRGEQRVGGFIGNIENESQVYIRDSYNSSFVKGFSYVGGFSGWLLNYSGLKIENSYNTGFIYGNDCIGGFVGCFENSSIITIINSYNSGSVNGIKKLGGFVGGRDLFFQKDYLKICNSYNSGTVKGGFGEAFVGSCEGCSVDYDNLFYLSGSANDGYGEEKSLIDFFNGTVVKELHDYNKKSVDGSVWGQTLGHDKFPTLSGIVGSPLFLHIYDNVVVDSVYIPGMSLSNRTRDGYVFLGWYADKNFSDEVVTEIPKDAVGEQNFYARWLKLDEYGCYEIATANELYSFAYIVRSGETDACGKLTKNIVVNKNVLATAKGVSNINADGEFTGDASGFKKWIPIGSDSKPFKGKFYGQGHTISGLYINQDSLYDYAGLFGYVKGDFVVIDGLGLKDSYFKGGDKVGGFVGLTNEALSISNSYNASVVIGGQDVGGFVGYAKAALFISNSYNEGIVIGDDCVGGFVGFASEDVTTSITNSYNSGSVSVFPGDGRASDFAGFVEGYVMIRNSYNTGAGDFVFPSSNAIFFNSFYIGESKFEGEEVMRKTAEEFADGSVALLLRSWCKEMEASCLDDDLNGSVWGQNVGQKNGNDASPTLSGVLKLGPITIAKNAAGKDSVSIDGNSALDVKIPTDIYVNQLTFNRSFSPGTTATLVLPFDVPASALPENVVFGALGSVGPNSENGGKWEAVFTKVSKLNAHVPYLLKFTEGSSLNFNFGDEGVIIKATKTYDEESGKMVPVQVSGKSFDNRWQLIGMYSYKAWLEGDPEIGKIYGFAADDDGDNVKVGQFVKVGEGAFINPMRVYLAPSTPSTLGRKVLGKAAVLASIPENLPESIDVVFVDSDDVVEANNFVVDSDNADVGKKKTSVGRLKAHTGTIEFRRTYDAKGRLLNAKPTATGNYFIKKMEE